MKIKFIILILLSLFMISNLYGSEDISQTNTNTQQIDEEFEEEDGFDDFSNELEVKKEFDPLKYYNELMTNVNHNLYINILTPTAKTYRSVVHEDIRGSIDNFFTNLRYPVNLLNNLLQLKFQNSVEETGRFLINSTLGLFGLFDPAGKIFNLKSHHEDFGQTLGYWGVGSGPHIVLPLLGPSNLRDLAGMFPDASVDPIDYVEDRKYNLAQSTSASIGYKAFKKVNNTSLNINQYEDMTKDAVLLYPYLKDMYEQYRIKQIQE